MCGIQPPGSPHDQLNERPIQRQERPPNAAESTLSRRIPLSTPWIVVCLTAHLRRNNNTSLSDGGYADVRNVDYPPPTHRKVLQRKAGICDAEHISEARNLTRDPQQNKPSRTHRLCTRRAHTVREASSHTLRHRLPSFVRALASCCRRGREEGESRSRGATAVSVQFLRPLSVLNLPPTWKRERRHHADDVVGRFRARGGKV